MMKLLKKQSISIEKFRQILGIWKTEIIIREDGFVETIQDINEKASQTGIIFSATVFCDYPTESSIMARLQL